MRPSNGVQLYPGPYRQLGPPPGGPGAYPASLPNPSLLQSSGSSSNKSQRQGPQARQLMDRVAALIDVVRRELDALKIPNEFNQIVATDQDVIVPPAVVMKIFNHDPMVRNATVFAALSVCASYEEEIKIATWQKNLLQYRYMLAEQLAIDLLGLFYTEPFITEAFGPNPFTSPEAREQFRHAHGLIYNESEIADPEFPNQLHFAHVKVMTDVLNNNWNEDTTTMEQAIAAGCKRFMSNMRVTSVIEHIWRGNIHHSNEGAFDNVITFDQRLKERNVLLSGPLALRNLLKVPRFQWLMETISHFMILSLYTIVINHQSNTIGIPEILLVWFVIGFSLNEYQKFKQQWSENRYLSNVWNLFVLFSIGVFASSFVTRGLALYYKDQAATLIKLSYEILSLNAVVLWVHCLNTFAMLQRFGFFLATIRQMVSDAPAFIIILGLVMIGFSQGIAVNGQGRLNFFAVLQELSKGIFGDHNFSFSNDVTPIFGNLLLSLYLLTCLVILLNLLIALLNDSYSRANSQKEGEWRMGFVTLTISFTAIDEADLLPPPFDLIALPFMPFVHWECLNRGSEAVKSLAINCIILSFCVVCPYSLPVAAFYALYDYQDHKKLRLTTGRYTSPIDRDSLALTADQLNVHPKVQLAIIRRHLDELRGRR
eukprot:tig00000361_g24403.t1